MKVERHRFLVLAAGIAAANGCNAGASPSAPPVVVPTATPAPDDGAPDASAPYASAAIDAAPAWTATPAPPDASSATEGDDDEDAGGCIDPRAAATPGDCKALRAPPGPHCESYDDTKTECEDLKKVLAPKVAERAVACLSQKSGQRSLCQFGVSGRCANEAFAATCPDPTTRATCQAILRRCSGARVQNVVGRLTMEACQGALAAVPPAKKDDMLSCMSEGCTVGYCFEDLL